MLTENFYMSIYWLLASGTGLTQKALRKTAVPIGIPGMSIFCVLSHKINKKRAEDEDRSSGAGEGEGGGAPGKENHQLPATNCLSRSSPFLHWCILLKKF